MPEIDWAGLLHQEDVEGLWNGLFRLVTRHPAARPLRFATDETTVSSTLEINADLAQELFLELFQKQRFEHYAANNYSSSEIENELTHIELPNLVGARLRKRYPESFRMARRVSSLLKTSTAFRKFGRGAVEVKAAVEPAASKQSHNGHGQSAAAVAAKTVASVKSESPVNGRSAKAGTGRAGSALPNHTGNSNGNGNGNGKGRIVAALSTSPLNGPFNGHSEEHSECIDEDYLQVEEWDTADGDAETASAPAPSSTVRPRRQRMVNQIYGLKRWPAGKPASDGGHFADLAKSVSVRPRDTRIVGRSGTSQLILSNKALEDLIIDIFKAIDSPADVKTIRQLTLSKIALQDYSIASLDDEFPKGDARPVGNNSPSNGSAKQSSARGAQAVDSRLSPEDQLLEQEHLEGVSSRAQDFLASLSRTVNHNPQRYERLIETLWYCYFDPKGPSQIETAELLGVSDSLVSNNRKLIEYELKKLGLSLEDGVVFSESLKRLVIKRRTRRSAPARSGAANADQNVKAAADAAANGRRPRQAVMPSRNKA